MARRIACTRRRPRCGSATWDDCSAGRRCRLSTPVEGASEPAAGPASRPASLGCEDVRVQRIRGYLRKRIDDYQETRRLESTAGIARAFPTPEEVRAYGTERIDELRSKRDDALLHIATLTALASEAPLLIPTVALGGAVLGAIFINAKVGGAAVSVLLFSLCALAMVVCALYGLRRARRCQATLTLLQFWVKDYDSAISELGGGVSGLLAGPGRGGWFSRFVAKSAPGSGL